RRDKRNINSALQQITKKSIITKNCFFSPVTCRLPIIGVKRKQRRQTLINQEYNKNSENIKNEKKIKEKDEPKVGKYFLALTYYSTPQTYWK
ncbi:hypothetical protein Mgra_00001026, partial [Meloidogyne graminicola]